MSTSYRLVADSSLAAQSDRDQSFLGGHPRLPASEALPVCGLCGADQAFFFQVAFPEDHAWAGRSVAVFACTSCAEKGFLIPEMLTGQLKGADIPEGFLARYQRNFRFLVFPTESGQLRTDYREAVRFQRWALRPADEVAKGDKTGGRPAWLLEDEAPRSYGGGTPMVFLLQLQIGQEFETAADAPRQALRSYDGKPRYSSATSYRLFLSNALYLFGTASGEPLVYAITQVE